LAEVEKEIDQINEQLTQSADPSRFRVSVTEIQDFAIRKTMQLKELLATDIKTARAALTKHLGKLSLLPAWPGFRQMVGHRSLARPVRRDE
jgi:hypothetical protein